MLSQPIQELIDKLKNQKTLKPSSPDDALINVNKLTEKAGAAYEKLRYLVDYKDERHIRRSAIERIIKRKIIFEKGEGIGLSLIQELIAGRYLANNTVPESAGKEIEKIILAYKTLEQNFPENFRNESHTRGKLVSLMASEIEEFFYPNNEDEWVAEAFYATVKDSIKTDVLVSEQFLQNQTLIACYRSLLNSDDETLFYKLWRRLVPADWLAYGDSVEMKELALHTPKLWSGIKMALVDQFNFRLLPKLGNDAIYFSIVREIARSYGAESERILSDDEAVSHFTADFLGKNYKRQYSKARGSAGRAVLYIFLTKSLLALALEFPYQLYILNAIEYIPIAINIIFHPVLLLAITVSVRPPGEANTKAIQNGVRKILLEGSSAPIKFRAKQNTSLNAIFLFFYAILFLIVFGFIMLVLQQLHFSIISTLLFLCFLALISYFALRIRHSANRWKVAREDNRTIALAFNLFALPIVQAGRWLSRKFSSINVFVFVMDFIIETPFKLMLQFADAFVSFLKERQEDVY